MACMWQGLSPEPRRCPRASAHPHTLETGSKSSARKPASAPISITDSRSLERPWKTAPLRHRAIERHTQASTTAEPAADQPPRTPPAAPHRSERGWPPGRRGSTRRCDPAAPAAGRLGRMVQPMRPGTPGLAGPITAAAVNADQGAIGPPTARPPAATPGRSATRATCSTHPAVNTATKEGAAHHRLDERRAAPVSDQEAQQGHPPGAKSQERLRKAEIATGEHATAEQPGSKAIEASMKLKRVITASDRTKATASSSGGTSVRRPNGQH